MLIKYSNGNEKLEVICNKDELQTVVNELKILMKEYKDEQKEVPKATCKYKKDKPIFKKIIVSKEDR